MAPEILKNHKYDYKVDFWALGILFYQMLFGYPPFTGKDLYDLGKNIRAGNYRIPKNIKMGLRHVKRHEKLATDLVSRISKMNQKEGKDAEVAVSFRLLMQHHNWMHCMRK